jgi:DNA-binding transcriptional LysR family regulator
MRVGTVAGAARALRVSQPTVTRVLRRMEDELRVTLFIRASGRLLPSRHAERFLAEIDPAFLQVSDAIDRAARAIDPDKRAVRFGASPSVGRRLAPRILASLIAERPALSAQLDVLTVSQVLPYLLDGGGDAAITLFPILDETLRSLPVGRGRPILLLPAGVPQATTPQALSELTWIVFEPGSVHGEVLSGLLTAAGVVPARTHRARLAETAVGLVEAGLGATIVDEFTAATADETRVRRGVWPADRTYDVFLHARITPADPALIEALRLKAKAVLSMP